MDKPKPNNTGSRIKGFVLLHIALLIYSTCPLFSKNASMHAFLSPGFIGFYGGFIVVLGIYALLWQQVIKYLPVTTAYANKGITIVWGLLLGRIVFGERISRRQIIAAVIIIAGTLLYVYADREETDREETDAE